MRLQTNKHFLSTFSGLRNRVFYGKGMRGEVDLNSVFYGEGMRDEVNLKRSSQLKV